jgi:hypothetical protein
MPPGCCRWCPISPRAAYVSGPPRLIADLRPLSRRLAPDDGRVLGLLIRRTPWAACAVGVCVRVRVRARARGRPRSVARCAASGERMPQFAPPDSGERRGRSAVPNRCRGVRGGAVNTAVAPPAQERWRGSPARRVGVVICADGREDAAGCATLAKYFTRARARARAQARAGRAAGAGAAAWRARPHGARRRPRPCRLS